MHSIENKLIVLSAVGLCYDHKCVLSDVNFTINKGDFCLFAGPNGSGKTSLLRLILGLLSPTSGTIAYYHDGKPVSSLDMGYLPQKNSIDSQFPITISEVVAMGLLGCKISRKERSFRIENMLEKVGLSSYVDAPIGTLSGGQLQRVLFCRAIISSPEVLVFDEPTSYIDKSFEPCMLELLHTMAGKTTILLVSHDVERFRHMTGRVFQVQNMVDEVK